MRVILTLVFLASLATGLAEPLRLAVLGGEDLLALPLLEALLSTSPDIALLERGELQKLVDEKQLSAFIAERRFGALGQMLSAEILLILEKIPLPDGTQQPTLKLISVKNGACLLLEPIPPSMSMEEWTAGIVVKLERALPMARVSRDQAIPLGLLGLRAEAASPGAFARESALARLLEMRLSSVPGVVLLDRRRLSDVSFERSLEAADLPSLTESSFLIDGSFADTPEGQPLQINLRLRRKDGSLLGTVVVAGSPTELPALSEKLTEAILEKVRKSPAAETGKSLESNEFFDEAVWAWKGGLLDTSLEALAAARALGEQGPDVLALYTWLLAEKAGYGGAIFNGRLLERTMPEPSVRNMLLLEAFGSLSDFLAQGGHAARIYDAWELQSRHLRRKVLESASDFLKERDNAGDSASLRELRQATRQAAGMDAEGPQMPYDMRQTAKLSCHWAETSVELLAFYEKLLRSPQKWQDLFLSEFPSSPREGLGRFANDPQAVAAWHAMWQRLLSADDTRLAALAVLSGRAKSPEQETYYREFLQEVSTKGASLKSRELTELLKAGPSGRQLGARFSEERGAAFQALCKTLSHFAHGLEEFLSNAKFPPGKEQEAWEDFISYQARCLEMARDERDRADMQHRFGNWSGVIRSNNPGIRIDFSLHALTVSRLWLGSEEFAEFNPRFFTTCDDSVWMAARGDECPDELVQVELPSLRVSRHPFPGAGQGSDLFVTADMISMLQLNYSESHTTFPNLLAWKDRKTGEFRRIPVPALAGPTIINNRLFVHTKGGSPDNNAALYEVDPRTERLSQIIGARRNPPQSPLDSIPGLEIQGVILGPGGTLYVSIDGQDSGIYEIGEDGKSFFSVKWPTILRDGSRSLLAGIRGGALFVDPAAQVPVWWMASDANSVSTLETSRWVASSDMNLWEHASAFRGNEMFFISREPSGEHSLCWWFGNGPRQGISIPLRFASAAGQKAVSEKSGDPQQPDPVPLAAVQNPTLLSSSAPLRILVVPQGLILHAGAHGFWFIPNADLDSWKQENYPADPKS